MLKAPLSLPSSLVLTLESKEALLHRSVHQSGPRQCQQHVLKRLPHPLTLLSLTTRPHVSPRALNMTDSVSVAPFSHWQFKKKKRKHVTVTTVAPCCSGVVRKPLCSLCKSFQRAVTLIIISADFTLNKGEKGLCCFVTLLEIKLKVLQSSWPMCSQSSVTSGWHKTLVSTLLLYRVYCLRQNNRCKYI